MAGWGTVYGEIPMKKRLLSFYPAVLQKLGPWLFFLGLTIFMTWPWMMSLQTSIIGWAGDNVYCVWLIGWMQLALKNLPANPLFVPMFNYPTGWDLAYTEITLANLVTALPFAVFGGPIFAYNITILISFLLSGWFMYRWVFSISQNRLAGLVAGTIFAFSPFRLAHSFGHLPLMGTQWLALHYFGLYKILVKREFKWQYCVMAGAGLGLAGLSSMYYLYMGFVVSSCFVVGYLVFVDFRVLMQKNTWKGLLVSGVVASPLIVLAVVPYLQLVRLGMANHRSVTDVDIFSAGLVDFFLPSPTHFIWGEWLSKLIARPLWIEMYIYLGVIPFVLAVIALLRIFKERSNQSKIIVWLAVSVIVAMVLAMGTTLHITSEPFRMSPVPEILKKWNITSQGLIPLPNYFLFKFLPFYDGMRAWDRYGIFVNLFLAVVAGMGFYLISKNIRNQKVAVGLFTLVVLLICVDYKVNMPLSQLEPRPVDLWLADQPGDGSVVQFPIQDSFQPTYIYGSLFHHKALFGTFYGAYLPKEYDLLLPDLRKFPNEKGIQILKDRKIDYILVDSKRYQDWASVKKSLDSSSLIFKTVIDNYYVYVLK